MLLKGKGFSACAISFKGCLIGVFILLFLLPLFLWFMPIIYEHLKKIMVFVLILASLALILKEKNKFMAFFVFLLSGILGVIVFKLPMKEPLFPLLTGLFGTTMLITTIKSKPKIPVQDTEEEKIEIKEAAKIIPSSIISSALCSFLPGLGSSQAAVLSTSSNSKLDERKFLFLLGVINTLVTGLNFIAIYSISKPRSGVAVVASKILGEFSIREVWLFASLMLLVSLISFYLALKVSKIFAKSINKINYSKISWIILIFLSVVTLFYSSWLGFLVLITSTLLGLFAININIKKIHLMGCLMIPVIFYFL
jgi:putative membrane protein